MTAKRKKIVISGRKDMRLDAFLCAEFEGLSRADARKTIEGGAVGYAGRTVSAPDFRVKTGMELEIALENRNDPEAKRAAEYGLVPERKIATVFEDDHILAVDKPAGLMVHRARGEPRETLVAYLLAAGKNPAQDPDAPERPGIVHRLDKDTSGLLLVVKSETAMRKLRQNFRERVTRIYAAIAVGELEGIRRYEDRIARHPVNRIKYALSETGGKPAIMTVKRIARTDDHGFVLARLATGRTHQIRVQLAGHGHPIVGDRLYGDSRRPQSAPRQMLHACLLSCEHPITGERLTWYREPPPCVMECAAKLGFEISKQTLEREAGSFAAQTQGGRVVEGS